ncbi:hypothetical protein HPB50_017257 [Hyalomma asiaticum]|uniref:Uncharacterized protein n=1 Tax=Hyalomma asiaticum TaxID=266040 RepID=A0ACB7SI95_HYAAI|nr:hypothetical protein HPB50_017257 [Hyalomma asiaticum]
MIFSISTNGEALPRRADQAPVPGQDSGSAPTRTNNARNGNMNGIQLKPLYFLRALRSPRLPLESLRVRRYERNHAFVRITSKKRDVRTRSCSRLRHSRDIYATQAEEVTPALSSSAATASAAAARRNALRWTQQEEGKRLARTPRPPPPPLIDRGKRRSPTGTTTMPVSAFAATFEGSPYVSSFYSSCCRFTVTRLFSSTLPRRLLSINRSAIFVYAMLLRSRSVHDTAGDVMRRGEARVTSRTHVYNVVPAR